MTHRSFVHSTVVIASLVAASSVSAQRTARVTGTVTETETGRPIPGVTVRVVGTAFGASTDNEGRYAIVNASSGLQTLEARRIGYGVRRVENVRLGADASSTVNFTLNANPLNIEEVVVSGTIDPTSKLKTAFTVDKLTAADIPVAPTQNAIVALQGK